MFSIKQALQKIVTIQSFPDKSVVDNNIYPHDLIGRDRSILKAPQGYSRPAMIIIETINSCTLDCIFCAYGSMQRPKGVMPLDTFEKILKDYEEIGGGQLSLTPVVGEVFTDPLLYKRLQMIEKYPGISGVSFTTNLVGMKRHKGDNFRDLLSKLNRVHISVYGLDAEEHKTITRKNTFDIFLRELKCLVESLDDLGKLWLNFRLLNKRSERDLERWLEHHLGFVPTHFYTYDYAKWSGHESAPVELPSDAQWSERAGIQSFCTIPIVAAQVHCNGNISICHCDDYECDPDLSLGNVGETTLAEAFQSLKYSEFWKLRGDAMPEFCRNCGFYNPPGDIEKLKRALVDPLSFIGG